ncbi:MAG: MFS transporter [Holosporaceae bacterium]|jgi:MFS family permease|nr:MFS transporter [Holosporaceae bacterium]
MSNKFLGMGKDVWFVSLFGLFLGMSTTMIYSQLSLFMKHVLHMEINNIAFIDGIVEFISYVMRIFAGIVSDCTSNRKLFLLVGSVITLLMKPVFASSQTALHIFIAQSIERVGNGLQASPRDALVADLSGSSEMTKSFCFNKCLKTVGALLGIPVAVSILYATGNNYRVVFCSASVAVIFAIILLLKTNKNTKTEHVNRQKNVFRKDFLKLFDATFWKIIALAVLYEAGHFSEHLLPLYANNFLSNTFAGTTGMFISIGQILFSIPIGIGADKLGKRPFIVMCILMIISANILFITASSHYHVYLGCILWGGQLTSVQSLFLSSISELVRHELRATAIGIYYCGIGASYLLASTIAGNLWTRYGSKYAFIYSICISTVTFILLPCLYSKKQSSAKMK